MTTTNTNHADIPHAPAWLNLSHVMTIDQLVEVEETVDRLREVEKMVATECERAYHVNQRLEGITWGPTGIPDDDGSAHDGLAAALRHYTGQEALWSALFDIASHVGAITDGFPKDDPAWAVAIKKAEANEEVSP